MDEATCPGADFSLPISLSTQISAINDGYPLKAALNLIDAIAPNDANFRKRIIPQSTLTRLKRAGETAKLARPIAEVVARLERIWRQVLKIYKQDNHKARAFLFRKHMMLEDQAPIDAALAGETSALFLDYVLGTIEYGFAA